MPTPDPQWPLTGGANFAVNPVNSSDVVISSSAGRIFSTTDQGGPGSTSATRRSSAVPAASASALAYGAPDPNAPAGIGNLGNFIYVGTQAGQIFVTQNGGGNGASNNWINISLGLDGGAVQSIITDPVRGSHDAYAVTSAGVFYIKDSVLLANNPTNTQFQWINITGNIHNLPYYHLRPELQPDDRPERDQAEPGPARAHVDRGRLAVLDPQQLRPTPTVRASTRSSTSARASVGNGSGVYQSLDDGLTWSLFPSTTFGGAWPRAATCPTPTSPTSTCRWATSTRARACPTWPARTTRTVRRQTPDPDLLLATTYGRGSFAINLAPLVFPSTVQVDSTGIAARRHSAGDHRHAHFSGLSSITGFGNATRITIMDVTDPNPTK